jgi:hypothetical protein
VDAILAAPRDPVTGRSLVDNGVIDFNLSLRDVLNPHFRSGADPTADAFQRLTYGGYLLRQGLSQSVPTRIVANRTMERQLLFDIGHPDAFRTTGKFHTAVLDEHDFALNRAAFTEVGYSRGNFYNTYCNARVTLSDGRVYVFGGHDMQSSNGLFKVNIFDPETEEWIRRAESCTRRSWREDPFGLLFFSQHPDKVFDIDAFYDDCDPRIQESTQPAEPSDQRYARWYPSAAPLPNDWVLVLGGFDQDNAVGPDPERATRVTTTGAPAPQQDAEFAASRVNIVVPEVYDPVTDRNIALENARMAFPLYPQMEVVSTGPGREDWMVCTMNGEESFGEEPVPGGARFFGPWRGKTWCLDVVAAMRDPNRSLPAQNHWRALDEADEVRPYCCPTASLLEIGQDGQTVSHRWFMISGQKDGQQTGTIEVIDFTDAVPHWSIVGSIQQPLSTTKAVVLPDGQVLIGHGINRSASCVVTEGGMSRPCTFEEREGHFFQMLDPDTAQVRRLARTTVSRGLHGTATLLPDGSVFFAGENREALVRPNDPFFPLGAAWAPDGVLMAGDPDQGVPVGQIFYPPYLFTSGGALAFSSRPAPAGRRPPEQDVVAPRRAEPAAVPGLGMLAGSEGLLGIEFEDFALAQRYGIIALAFILFSGGAGTAWRDIRRVLVPGRGAGHGGVLLSAVVLGALAAPCSACRCSRACCSARSSRRPTPRPSSRSCGRAAWPSCRGCATCSSSSRAATTRRPCSSRSA